MASISKTAYQILGIGERAPQKEIKNTYKRWDFGLIQTRILTIHKLNQRFKWSVRAGFQMFIHSLIMYEVSD